MTLIQAGKNKKLGPNRKIDLCCFNLSMSTLKSILFSWHVFHARMGQWILCSELHLFDTKHARCHALTHKRRRGFAEREAVIFQKCVCVCVWKHLGTRCNGFSTFYCRGPEGMGGVSGQRRRPPIPCKRTCIFFRKWQEAKPRTSTNFTGTPPRRTTRNGYGRTMF